jgi:hypothetical protein
MKGKHRSRRHVPGGIANTINRQHRHSFCEMNEGEKRLSWAPQATTESGQWVGNGLRFATREEAEAYVAGLSSGRNTRVVESSDPVNYRWMHFHSHSN